MKIIQNLPNFYGRYEELTQYVSQLSLLCILSTYMTHAEIRDNDYATGREAHNQ